VYFWRLKNYLLKVSCENNLIHEKIMDAFKTHEQVISNYRSYLSSFLNIADDRIKEEVKRAFESDGLIPNPLVSFNPSFEKGDSLKDRPVKAVQS